MMFNFLLTKFVKKTTVYSPHPRRLEKFKYLQMKLTESFPMHPHAPGN